MKNVNISGIGALLGSGSLSAGIEFLGISQGAPGSIVVNNVYSWQVCLLIILACYINNPVIFFQLTELPTTTLPTTIGPSMSTIKTTRRGRTYYSVAARTEKFGALGVMQVLCWLSITSY